MEISRELVRTGSPKYVALANALAEQIRTTLAIGDPLPTERELQAGFGVSRDTVRRAIARLAAAGLVFNVQGSGTYVADPAQIRKGPRLTGFSQDMAERGLRASSRTLDCRIEPCPADTARALGVAEGSGVLLLRRLRLADQAPMALETARLLPGLFGDGLPDPEGSLDTQLAEHGQRIMRASQTITATNLTATEAHLLDQPVGAAALRVDRVGFTDRGRAIEATETLYRGDRYGYETAVERDPS
ncbi:GntR family transcriptional regulator [Paeniglutamicibacter sp. ABSL32-1]|uniref:GntR family transcriptional regulator n=1 Tax=Paeniglutamicibacter quisquiliarum TaxID=2849498 RepID=UPI001C2CD630|nr:GntR family transcriptional regulator [Paeniglutamicibacter quisquiliarum]MBV1779974.1 GntR family transcriptional regulator [Paeniglutamicibacter quisquiliarum]